MRKVAEERRRKRGRRVATRTPYLVRFTLRHSCVHVTSGSELDVSNVKLACITLPQDLDDTNQAAKARAATKMLMNKKMLLEDVFNFET